MGQDQWFVRTSKLLDVGRQIQQMRVHLAELACVQVAGKMREAFECVRQISATVEIDLAEQLLGPLMDHEQTAWFCGFGRIRPSQQGRSGCRRQPAEGRRSAEQKGTPAECSALTEGSHESLRDCCRRLALYASGTGHPSDLSSHIPVSADSDP